MSNEAGEPKMEEEVKNRRKEEMKRGMEGRMSQQRERTSKTKRQSWGKKEELIHRPTFSEI